MTEAKSKRPIKTVLPQHLAGGPHGLGDPDNQTLRKVEEEICIPRLMKQIAHNEKCPAEVKVFEECGADKGLLLPFKCRKENKAMQDCLSKWYSDEEFKKQVVDQYLLERSHYRRTGHPVMRYERGRKIQPKFPEDFPTKPETG